MAAAALTALALLQAGQSSARTHNTKPKPHCALRRGWKVVADGSQAVVITGEITALQPDGTTLREQQWRYCLRKAGVFKTLVTNTGVDGGYADIFRVADVLLSGIYVAYDSQDELGGGRYGNTAGVAVTDLITGQNVGGEVLGNSVYGLLLAPPIAAWEASVDVAVAAVPFLLTPSSYLSAVSSTRTMLPGPVGAACHVLFRPRFRLRGDLRIAGSRPRNRRRTHRRTRRLHRYLPRAV